jgi:predicted RecA/RadA family phage recombinase
MNNFIQHGEVLTLPAPYNVASGGGVLLGNIFGIASYSASTGEDVEARTCGVFDLVAATHASTQALAAGDPVYWDDSAKKATKTATGNSQIGTAVKAKASTVAVVRVKLMPVGVVKTSGAAVADAAPGADATALRTTLNALLASLRASGAIQT